MKSIIALALGVLVVLSGMNFYSHDSAKRDIDGFIEDRFPEIKEWKSGLNVNYRVLNDDDKKDIADRLKESKEVSSHYVDLILGKEDFVNIGYAGNLFYLQSEGEFEYLEVYDLRIGDLEGIEECGEDCDFYSDEDVNIDKGLYKVVGHQKCDRYQAPFSCEVLLGQKGLVEPFDFFAYKKRLIIGELNTGNGIYIFSGKFGSKIGDLVSQRRRSAANI